MQAALGTLRAWMHVIRFPNVLFVLSMSDAQRCPRRHSCTVPVLSIAKKVLRGGCMVA